MAPVSTTGPRPSSALITVFILTLSPVLKSLSQSTSSDSIWTLSVWLTLMNIVTTDYHFDVERPFNRIFATNVLLADVTMLAYRLSSSTAVFCFVLFAVQFHRLFPVWQMWLRLHHPKVHWSVMVGIGLIVDVLITCMLGWEVLAVWMLVHGGAVVGCPVYFLMLQKYKDGLKGPWDPAKPTI